MAQYEKRQRDYERKEQEKHLAVQPIQDITLMELQSKIQTLEKIEAV